MNMNMGNDDQQNYMYMGNNMPNPVQNYKQGGPSMGYNSYEQVQQQGGYKEYSSFQNNRK